jgi:Topoisomerase IA
MVVLIAEKPSVGQELARITRCGKGGDGFREGGRIEEGPLAGKECCVTWAIGHLVEIVQEPETAALHWKLENLPVIPDHFLLEPARKDRKSKSPDPGYVKQLKVIQRLFSKCEAIVNCGDAGREGEVIQRYIHRYVIEQDARCRKPVWRMWTSSMTDEALKNGLRDIRPSSEYDDLYEAGRMRNEADWMVGCNATEVLTIKANVKGMDGRRKTLSLGRVQTPTLALVCSRFLENQNFVPVPFWTVRLATESKGQPFTVRSERRFDTFGEAESLAKRCKVSLLTVDKVERKGRTENPPLLHDITSAQQEASKRYGLDPDQTLNIIQELYDAKLVTYPRTGSRFISKDVFATIPGRIANVADSIANPKLRAAAQSMAGLGLKGLNKRSVNDGKVTDHHALLIEKTRPGELTDRQRKIYDLIAQRMLEAFSEPCEMEVYSVHFTCAGEEFVASSMKVLKPGWRSVGGLQEQAVPAEEETDGKDGADEREKDQKLPELRQGDALGVKDAETVQGQTKPKPIYTMNTLLDAMKTAGKESDDDDIKAAMKDVGIGTPATRASIIKLLVEERKFIEKKKGQKVVPTKEGLEVYNLVKDMGIANVELTGRWEVALGMVADGKMAPGKFRSLIEEFTRKLCAQLMSVSSVGALSEAAASETIRCPLCGQPMRMFPDFVKCSNPECGVSMNRTVCQKKLPDKVLKTLIEDGKTPVLGGFVSKKGSTFSAALKRSVIEREGRRYFNADFDFDAAKKSASGGGGKPWKKGSGKPRASKNA